MKNMKNFYIIIFFLIIFLLRCNRPNNSFHLSDTKNIKNTICIFFTGEALGELEPCGCSGMKTGGLLIRSGWIDNLKKEYSYLYLIDGGFNTPVWNYQNKIKFKVYREALNILGYNYQFLGEKENIPKNVDYFKPPIFLSPISIIKKRKEKQSKIKFWDKKEIKIDKYKYTFLFLALNKKSNKEEIIKLIKKVKPNLIIALVKGIYENFSNLIPIKGYKKIFLSIDSQEPLTPNFENKENLVVIPGNKARYGGIIKIRLEKGKVKDFIAKIVTLEKNFEPNPKIEKLMKKYLNRLKKERLLEREIKMSSPVGFVGSQVCEQCHEKEYKIWTQKEHSKAFELLKKVGHDYDPECVKCHVIGYKYEEGFRSPAETPYFENVGCECCHGPGAYHLANPEAPGYGKTNGEFTCLECHEPERSPHFDYKKYLEKIKHWKDKNTKKQEENNIEKEKK